jgi:hypothetical protein
MMARSTAAAQPSANITLRTFTMTRHHLLTPPARQRNKCDSLAVIFSQDVIGCDRNS